MALKRRMEPSYQGTFTGARRYVLETFANTKSALMKKRVSQYIIGRPCPTCDGKRLKREALSVKFAGLDIAEFGDLTVLKLADLLTPVAHGEYGAASAASTGHVLEKRPAMQRSKNGLPRAALRTRARPTCAARPISPTKSGSPLNALPAN